MGIALLGNVAIKNIISPDSVGDATLSPELKRESSAGTIGLVVVGIFGISVFWLLHLAALLFTKFNAADNDDFAAFVTGSLDPYLKECATTLGTIFGSTLGFVFGYYFKATSSASAKSTSG